VQPSARKGVIVNQVQAGHPDLAERDFFERYTQTPAFQPL
jgi:hypothetical protein